MGGCFACIDPAVIRRACDASGDTLHGSLGNRALARMTGTNGGSSGFASRE